MRDRLFLLADWSYSNHPISENRGHVVVKQDVTLWHGWLEEHALFDSRERCFSRERDIFTTVFSIHSGLLVCLTGHARM